MVIRYPQNFYIYVVGLIMEIKMCWGQQHKVVEKLQLLLRTEMIFGILCFTLLGAQILCPLKPT